MAPPAVLIKVTTAISKFQVPSTHGGYRLVALNISYYSYNFFWSSFRANLSQIGSNPVYHPVTLEISSSVTWPVWHLTRLVSNVIQNIT